MDNFHEKFRQIYIAYKPVVVIAVTVSSLWTNYSSIGPFLFQILFILF